MNMQQQTIRRWQDKQWHDDTDTVSREVRVHITLAGERFQLWASPHDEQGLSLLALGHALLESGGGRGSRRLVPESALSQKATVRQLPAANGEYAFAVSFVPRGSSEAEPAEHNDDATSSVRLATPTAVSPWEGVTPELLVATMDEIMGQSTLWEATGCFHRCAVWDPLEHRVVFVAEDIGRHNCLDRAAGWAWQEGRDLSRHALFLSARITASLYAKACRTGARCLVSASAVSSAAIQGAHKDGITLVGFCRPKEGRLSVYVNGLPLPDLESPR